MCLKRVLSLCVSECLCRNHSTWNIQIGRIGIKWTSWMNLSISIFLVAERVWQTWLISFGRPFSSTFRIVFWCVSVMPYNQHSQLLSRFIKLTIILTWSIHWQQVVTTLNRKVLISFEMSNVKHETFSN